jgi:cytoskeletal protein RodZ
MGGDEFEEEAFETPTGRVGERLRAAREARGLSLQDIAKETRIPIRHLESLESSEYGALPGKTYAIGFAKAYARAIDGDEAEVSEAVRGEYDFIDSGERHEYQAFQPADPSRVPSRFLAWTAGIVAVLLFGAYLIWKPFSDGGDPYAASEPAAAPGISGQDRAPAPAATGDTVAADAPIVLTANALVWFRIDDAQGNRLHEQELAAGQSYTVPRDATGLLLRTARPQALDITVGGRKIATLGPPDTLVSNVPLDPRALVSRANAGP